MTLTQTKTLADIRDEAWSLMDQHGLTDKGWTFAFDNAKKRGGYCQYSKKRISLSRAICPLWSQEEITETILHEIAHALVGPGHHHDAVWRKQARMIGSNGSRTHSNETAPPKYIGTCPQGHTHQAYRRRKNVQSCGHCSSKFDTRYLISWKEA